jgi:hypothetical protein
MNTRRDECLLGELRMGREDRRSVRSSAPSSLRRPDTTPSPPANESTLLRRWRRPPPSPPCSIPVSEEEEETKTEIMSGCAPSELPTSEIATVHHNVRHHVSIVPPKKGASSLGAAEQEIDGSRAPQAGNGGSILMKNAPSAASGAPGGMLRNDGVEYDVGGDEDARGRSGGVAGGGAAKPAVAPAPGPLQRTNQPRWGAPGAYRVVGPAGDNDETSIDDLSAGAGRGANQDGAHDDNNDGRPALVEASLVTEPPLVVASPVNDEHRGGSSGAKLWHGRSPSRRRMILLAFICVGVISAAVGVTISIVGRSKGEDHSDERYLRSVLPNSTVAAMDDPGSPQYQALQWVTDDVYLLKLDINDDEEWHGRLKQRFALAVFFYAVSSGAPGLHTEGNWLRRDTSECEWHGCKCSKEQRMQELSVRDYDLVGHIPTEIELLDQLVSFDSGNTSVFGQLPTEIAVLTRLSDLRIDKTRLSGTIPTEIGFLTRLEVLHLQSADLTGAIPSELAALTKLRSLRIDNTALNGTLPAELGQLASLTSLSVKNTIFGGAIPAELGLLSNLAWLELQDTLIRGSVPGALCHLVGSAKVNISVSCLLVSCDCGCMCGSDLL